jgi:hypothetical protein
VLLAQVSALLDVAPGNIELVPPLEADVQAALKSAGTAPAAAEGNTTPLALRLHLGPGAEKEAKAAEVSAAVQAPAFADALMGKLKAAGGGFAALSAVAAGPSKVASLAGPAVGASAEGGGGAEGAKATPVEDARDLSVFLWDIVGGGAAVFVVLMLLVHFRWSHWQQLAARQEGGGGVGGEGGAGPTAAGAAAASSAAILNRIRQGTESIGSVSGLKRGAAGASGSSVKPDTRSYELVETGRVGEGAGGVGAKVVGEGHDEEEEEDIEMI